MRSRKLLSRIHDLLSARNLLDGPPSVGHIIPSIEVRLNPEINSRRNVLFLSLPRWLNFILAKLLLLLLTDGPTCVAHICRNDANVRMQTTHGYSFQIGNAFQNAHVVTSDAVCPIGSSNMPHTAIRPASRLKTGFDSYLVGLRLHRVPPGQFQLSWETRLHAKKQSTARARYRPIESQQSLRECRTELPQR